MRRGLRSIPAAFALLVLGLGATSAFGEPKAARTGSRGVVTAAGSAWAASSVQGRATSRPVRARQAWPAQCRDPYPAKRDPKNPLMLAQSPGADPLNGARFFVDGPRHGPAAEAIASLLGVDPTRYPDDYSWAQFKSDIEQGPLHSRLMAASGRVRWKVAMLEKIASQPEAMRFSAYSGGGGPGKVFGQVQKLFCHNLTADPGTIPVFTTYFLHPNIRCGTAGQINAGAPTFKRQVDEVAEGTGNRPAVFLLELDAIGSSHCFANDHTLRQYLGLLRYEAEKLGSLPHTVVYEEAGYSDANTVSYTARALNAAGVRRIRGFFTNDTHENWTIDEVRWAQAIARRTGGAHFIVNTAQNGRGPLKNPHPATQGNEDLCNPPGRGLGPQDTTDTRFAGADAFLWTYVPGNSSGCGGGPPAGVFWPSRAVGLASRANAKLGPGYPNKPY